MDRRQWFDQLASTWDATFTEDVTARLREIVAGLNIRPGARILDIGCGTGVLAAMLLDRAGCTSAVVALDISVEMLNRAQAKGLPVRYLLADGEKLPLRDDSFDWVICNAVFPHFPDKPAALGEIRRMLKEAGRLLICHPKGRALVNTIHRELGPPISADLIPPEEEMHSLLSAANLDHASIRDVPDRYVVLASRPLQNEERGQQEPEAPIRLSSLET